MMLKLLNHIAISLGLIYALSACASSDPFATTLNGDIEAIAYKPSAYQNANFRLGGQILSVKTTGELTEIEILALPLNAEGRPLGYLSKGRFLAIINTPKDISTYKENGLITLIGSVAGMRDLNDGNAKFQQVIIHASAHRTWKNPSNYNRDKAALGFNNIGSGPANPGFGFNIPLKKQ